ncbi:hypothetical protein [Meridianimarinicoccus sp. MJW13]|nr:hypothetical protein [Fluviibacterium sp. MJW13]
MWFLVSAFLAAIRAGVAGATPPIALFQQHRDIPETHFKKSRNRT